MTTREEIDARNMAASLLHKRQVFDSLVDSMMEFRLCYPIHAVVICPHCGKGYMAPASAAAKAEESK